jgi:hypothetical protein
MRIYKNRPTIYVAEKMFGAADPFGLPKQSVNQFCHVPGVLLWEALTSKEWFAMKLTAEL